VLDGDANLDNKVNIADLAIVGRAFGTRPGDARWDPRADVGRNTGNPLPIPDGKIDIGDLIIVGRNYGHVKS
jgi:hypothetical protein